MPSEHVLDHATETRALTMAELGWVAGLIDGEGCLGIVNLQQLPIRFMLRVVMTDRRGPDRLKWLLGGTVRCQLKKAPRQPAWCWTCRQRTLVPLLKAVVSHLFIKCDEAAAVLQHLDAPLPTWEDAERLRRAMSLRKTKRGRLAVRILESAAR